jgi:hypothetical protein
MMCLIIISEKTFHHRDTGHVGWVERSDTHLYLGNLMMGIAVLNPSYELWLIDFAGFPCANT